MGANPWVALPQTPPYILPQDKAALKRYGISADALGWRLDLLPVPWIGSTAEASVVLLTLNPSLGDVAREKSDLDFRKAYWRNLKFKARFLWLDERFRGSDGYEYWAQLLKTPIESFGNDHLSRRIMCVQYSPYRSKTYVDSRCVIPSQLFSWAMARRAVEDGRLVVVQRSWRLWVSAVPELADYPCIRLRNVRRPFLSEGNMSASDWARFVSALSN